MHLFFTESYEARMQIKCRNRFAILFTSFRSCPALIARALHNVSHRDNKKTAVPTKETAAFYLVMRAAFRVPRAKILYTQNAERATQNAIVRSKSREHNKGAITGRYSDLRLTSKLLPIRHKLIWRTVDKCLSDSRIEK